MFPREGWNTPILPGLLGQCLRWYRLIILNRNFLNFYSPNGSIPPFILNHWTTFWINVISESNETKARMPWNFKWGHFVRWSFRPVVFHWDIIFFTLLLKRSDKTPFYRYSEEKLEYLEILKEEHLLDGNVGLLFWIKLFYVLTFRVVVHPHYQ